MAWACTEAFSAEVFEDDSIDTYINQNNIATAADATTNHTLFIDLILEKIFDLLPERELKNARLVCRYWNNMSIPFLRRKCSEISFNDDNYWTNATNHGVDSMKKFVNLVGNSENFPFVKFDIGTSVITFLHENTVNDFFTICGPLAESLTIRDEWGKRIFRNGYPSNLNFSKLQELVLHLLQTTTNIQHFFGFIDVVLQAAPNLRRLILINHNGMDEGDVVTFMIAAVKRAHFKYLTELEIEAQMNDCHLISLSKLGLKLTSLNFDLWGSQFKTESLKIFLESQRKTLHSIKIADAAMSTNCLVEFPCMEELKTLKVKGSMLGRISVSFPSISYTTQFPKLHKLALYELYGEWDEFLMPGTQPSLMVEELKLPCDFGDDLSLRRASVIFPRLKKLEVPHYQHVLEAVYETMPNLEELVINTRYINNIDNVITGIPAEICQQILETQMFREVEANLSRFQTKRSITSLKKLKRLRLKCKRSSDVVEITDVTGYLALIHMDALKYLDLGSRPLQISGECIAKMSEKFLILR